MTNQSDYTKALILLQSFETFWTFCSMSDGELYGEECKKVTIELIKVLKRIYRDDKRIFNSKELTLDSNNDTKLMQGIIRNLTEWGKSKDRLPYERIFESSWRISLFTMGLKIYLLKLVDPGVEIPIIWSSREMRYSKTKLRWGAHLPHHMLKKIPEDIESDLSNSRTIAVVGDIRKSQDLMTYAPSSKFFSEMMLDFMETSRKLIKDNFGVFDKFTGDGFLAYFNEEVCLKASKNFHDCFLNFSHALMQYSKEHFTKWTKSIRKLPLGLCGLTIGADIGKIDFKEIDGHLFAIGDTIVWANRVCSAGKSEDLIVNNILYNELKDKKGVSFEEIESSTKAGESFVAYRMNKNNAANK